VAGDGDGGRSGGAGAGKAAGDGGGETPASPEKVVGRRLDRAPLLPSSLLLLSMMSAAATWTFVVLYAKWLGISEGGIARLFLIQGGFGIFSQTLLAGISDRVGRGRVVAAGFVITAAGTLFLSQANGFNWLLAGMIGSWLG